MNGTSIGALIGDGLIGQVDLGREVQSQKVFYRSSPALSIVFGNVQKASGDDTRQVRQSHDL